MRSSSGLNNPSNNMVNNNTNFYNSLKLKNNNNIISYNGYDSNNNNNNNKKNNNFNNINNNNNNINYNKNINDNMLKSNIKVIDKEKRISSSISNISNMNSTGILNSNLRNSAIHIQAQSHNNLNIFRNSQIDRANKKYENTNTSDEKRSSLIILNEARNSAKPLNGNARLPNINNIDKLKIRKLINSNNSNQLFKFYKSNSNK
jgi:hypothetical protein